MNHPSNERGILDRWITGAGDFSTGTSSLNKTPVQPLAASFFYGIIELDGADTRLPHFIGDTDGKEPHIGMRLQAVFKEERAGNMLDILYFKPVKVRKMQDKKEVKKKS